jgi:predicted metallopeptidase
MTTPTPPTFGQPAAAAEQPTFVVSDEVRAVARRVIADHPGRLGDLEQFRIAFLLNHGTPPGDETGVHAIAKAIRAPDLWATLAEKDAAVWVLADVWPSLSERQRQAVIYHELLHFIVTDKGALRLVKHDVEEFIAVVSEYGAWHGALDALAQQLTLRDATADRDGPLRIVPDEGAPAD